MSVWFGTSSPAETLEPESDPSDAAAAASHAPAPMSLRAWAAIQLRVPDSGIDWLDRMIERSRELDASK